MRPGRTFLLGALVVLVSSCASASGRASDDSISALPTTPPVASTTTTVPAPAQTCGTGSLRPPASSPAPTVDAIRARGFLVVGVDQNTTGFADRNPLTGNIEGFEIDLVHEMARAIFGDPDKVTFKALNTSQRIAEVQNHHVDMTVSLVTITCARLQSVAFSTVYYLAHQALLVPTGSTITGAAGLRGKRVCATSGSTSLDNITRNYQGVPYPVDSRTDCLVALQEGKVDAITSDDTILAGFHEQDPDHTTILPDSLEAEPYGMAIALDHPDLVRFVNGVLAQLRADGRLDAMRQNWVGALGVDDPEPDPSYRD
jgi:polar amino acid transport system substrate-binding protein